MVVSNFEGASELLPKDASGMEMNPPEFIDVPAGTYIYGHRSLMPRRFERTEETKTKEIEAAHDAVAAALKGIDLAKKSGRKSLDGEISGRPWMKANRELDSAGSSRKNSIDQQHKPGPNLSAAAKPFDISKLDSLPEHDTPAPQSITTFQHNAKASRLSTTVEHRTRGLRESTALEHHAPAKS